MPKFYKLRGEKLPSVLYHGDRIYEFVKTDPTTFVFETEDPAAIKFLEDVGYRKMEPAPESKVENEPEVEAPLPLPHAPTPKKPSTGKK